MDTDNNVVADEATTVKTTYPNLWTVKFHNDDTTPMDFVVAVLREIFSLPIEEAAAITLKIHTDGSAIVGLFTREIAETKERKVLMLAVEYGHPLKVEALAV